MEAAGPWITSLEEDAVLDAMRNWYGDRKYDYCERFQREFAAYHGRKHALMTPNCTTAIHLLLASLGISEGDEVILPECTWIATGAGISYLNATPVFCDIDPLTWCLDADSVESQITERTKAIIVVDVFGNMPDMTALLDVADRHGIPLIEDAAEAVGSVLNGQTAGGFGIASVFSFHRTKTITTGEGGMLLLDDDALFKRASFLRDHGRRPDGPMYYNYEVTFKYMPFNMQAALGYAQFQRVEELVGRKREQLEFYREHLGGIEDVYLNPEPLHGRNGAWITGLLLGRSHGITKERAVDDLVGKGIPARPFFYPLSSLPAYPGCRSTYEPLNPVAYDICSRGINLPGAANLTHDDLSTVCDGVRTLLGK